MREEAVKPQQAAMPQQARPPSDGDLHRWIAEAAYYRAESRGFQPGGEMQDWLAAEAEVLARNSVTPNSVAR